MDRRDEGQLELFSSSAESRSSGSPFQRDRSLLARVRVFEKTILMMISILITGVVAYTAGMEKGKRNARQSVPLAQNAAFAQAQASVSQPVMPLAATTQVTLQAQAMDATGAAGAASAGLPAGLPAGASRSLNSERGLPAGASRSLNSERGQRYTIQLASYKTRSAAEKEGARLKKLGYTVIISAKGEYSVLSIGNFASKEKAQSLLTEMKKRYTGCFVRKL